MPSPGMLQRRTAGLSSLATMMNLLPNHLPVVAKYTAFLLVLLNVKSFPFAWHLRVFAPVISLRIQWVFLCLRLLFTSKSRAAKVKQTWLDSLSPVGQNPLAIRVVHRAWVGPDDADYNFHLSNSCYPKIMDGARLRAALAMCPSFFRHGGWMALGATHHHFIREIPIFASYEVRIGIATWDHKWIYIVSRFVTKPKEGKKGSKPTKPLKANEHAPTALPAVHTPSTPLDTPSISGTTTPAIQPNEGSATTTTDVDVSAVRLARTAAAQPEADGATLHCVAVSVMCFKHGRITVPPAVAIASEGLTAPAADGLQPFSHENPPPSWIAHAQKLRAQNNAKGYVTFLRGGWRDVPEGERWWEHALGGEVERVRAERLGALEGLVSGVAGARECPPLEA